MSVSPARTSALSPAALVDAEHLRADVDAAVTAHLDELAAEVGAISPSAEVMVEEAAGLLLGGKRLRAAFCYWSFRAHGGSADAADPPAPPPSGWAPRSSSSRRRRCCTTT